MTAIRITREFSFEMAHALCGYDGKCSSIHGHSYTLSVTVKGNPITDANHPKSGMVIDFSILKEIVQNEIIQYFDHALVINQSSPEKDKVAGLNMFNRMLTVPYQPTCENMLSDFAARINSKLPGNVSLFSLRLRETANAFAEWFASDNN